MEIKRVCGRDNLCMVIIILSSVIVPIFIT